MKIFITLISLFLINSFCLSQWSKVNIGIEGIKISSIINVNDSSIFIGSIGSGIYSSNDNGGSWVKKINGLTDLNISCLKVHENYIFAGTTNGTMFITQDNGNNWTKLNNGIPKNSVWSIAVDSNKIFVGTRDSGLFISSDFGQTWALRNRDLIYIKCLEIKKDTLFVGTYNSGLNITPLNGNQWLQRNKGLDDPDIRTMYFNNDMIYVGTSALGVFETSNNGESWRNFEFSPTDFYSVRAINKVEDYFIFGCYNQGVYLATKNSIFWNKINDGLTDLSVFTMSINNKYMFALTNSGLFRAKISDYIISDVNESKENQISISPNPASDYIEISLSPGGGGRGWSLSNVVISSEAKNLVRIYNALGEAQDAPPQTPPLEGRGLKIDISNLPSGVYFIKIGDKFEKFIKL